MERDSNFDRVVPGYVIGGLGPIAVAAVLVPLRDHVATANLALIMVLVVVLAAVVGGRGPAALAAVIAAVSFDFFLTQPYLSMQIESADDVETMAILLVIGVAVGQIAVRSRRHRIEARRGADEIARLHRIAELASSGASADVLITTLEMELADELHLRDCRYEPVVIARVLPRLERNGAVTGMHEHHFVDRGMTLPPECELPVVGRGRELGRFVLVADPSFGCTLEERIVAVAMSDQLGAVLATEPDPEHINPEEH
ncbi:MAG: DUF4118 domain-containing protein [Acidimicrobiia bacterium]